MKLNISIDAKAVQDQLIEMGQGKQVPFALSKSLNDLAKLVQKEVRAGIEERFKLNRKTWIFQRVKIEKENWATKTRLVVTIGITDDASFLQDMESGKVHVPGMGRSVLALPNSDVFKGRPIMRTNPLHIKNLGLTKTKSGIQGANSTFMVRTQSSGLRGLILQHTQSSGKRKKRMKLGTKWYTGNRTLYTLISRTKRPAKLRFIVTATNVVRTNWEPVFTRNILAAIKTSKRK